MPGGEQHAQRQNTVGLRITFLASTIRVTMGKDEEGGGRRRRRRREENRYHARDDDDSTAIQFKNHSYKASPDP